MHRRNIIGIVRISSINSSDTGSGRPDRDRSLRIGTSASVGGAKPSSSTERPLERRLREHMRPHGRPMLCPNKMVAA
jgi:hypothetical protein